jgi:hypothetical protein
MWRPRLLAILLFSAAVAPAAAQAVAPSAAADRKPVHDLSDLPRFAYPLKGDLGRFIDHPDELAPLAAQLKADAARTVAEYDIKDRATLGQLHKVLRSVAIYQNDAAAFEAQNQQVRSYQDKPALKVWLGLVDSARFSAAASAKPGTDAYAAAFRDALRSKLDALDWSVAGQTVKERYRGLATSSVGLVRGAIAEYLQPSVDAGGTLDMNGFADLLDYVNLVRVNYPLIDAERDVERAWIARNDKPKADIWQARTIVLPQSARLAPVVVGIWDGGTDASVFGPAMWVNPKETVNGRDDDGNGWVDDVHGVAIDVMGKRAAPTLQPVPTEFTKELGQLDIVNAGLADIQTGRDSADATKAVAIFRNSSADQAKALLSGLGWYGGYAHGTHVGGIAAAGNPAAKLLVARTSFDWRSPPRRPTEETARAFAQAHKDIVDYFKAHGVRVVNMSWGVGLKDEYENQLIANGVSPEQAATEGKRLFAIERQGLFEALKGAPDILFVCAAGNANDDAEFNGTAPSSFDLPNVITVAAVDQAGEPTNFTTSGKSVDIAASGYQVESYVPGGRRVRWSGTSMASPQVTNAAAKLFALDPKLSVGQVREILLSTATKGAGGFLLLDSRAAVARVAPQVIAAK